MSSTAQANPPRGAATVQYSPSNGCRQPLLAPAPATSAAVLRECESAPRRARACTWGPHMACREPADGADGGQGPASGQARAGNMCGAFELDVETPTGVSRAKRQCPLSVSTRLRTWRPRKPPVYLLFIWRPESFFGLVHWTAGSWITLSLSCCGCRTSTDQEATDMAIKKAMADFVVSLSEGGYLGSLEVVLTCPASPP